MLHETAVRSGRKAGLICAITGVLFSNIFLMIAGLTSSLLKPDWFFPVSAAVLLILTIGYYGGRKAGKKVMGGTSPYLAGQILSWSAMLIPAISLTLINTLLVIALYLDPVSYKNALFDYFLKPVYWIFVVGFIPAILLGILWAGLFRHFQRRA